MSTDPTMPSAGDPRYFGRYQYGGNNPYKYTDPSGESLAVPFATAGSALGPFGTAGGYFVGWLATSYISDEITRYVSDRLFNESSEDEAADASNDVDRASEIASELADKWEYGDCGPCAEELIDALEAEGITGNKVVVSFTGKNGFVHSDKKKGGGWQAMASMLVYKWEIRYLTILVKLKAGMIGKMIFMDMVRKK